MVSKAGIRASIDIGVVFISGGRMHFALPDARFAPDKIDCAMMREGSEPGRKRAVGIERLARLMNGDQGFLHHIINPVRRHTAPPRRADDNRDALAEQRLIRGAVSGLRRNHQPGKPAICFDGVAVRPACWHRLADRSGSNRGKTYLETSGPPPHKCSPGHHFVIVRT
jgi:hypothetical protein